jgi:alkanesulfonate monooxygenase SsuD/methylene tetrahydromethanopterin reductase-like flavin-dependent oxidoreductase (luciferase family)
MGDPAAPTAIELGLDTFGDVTLGPDGQPLHQAQVLRHVVEEAVLADRVGVAFFGVGEHHRADFAVSSPEVVLAAIAGKTARIRLGSAVTVLSSDDPVLAALVDQEPVTWSGKTRAPLTAQRVFPPVERPPLRTWIGVGGSPESVIPAARYNLPLMLAIIGGHPQRFVAYVDLYRRALKQFGIPIGLPVGAHSPGHVAATDEEGREDLWPHYQAMMSRIGAERGWPPVTRAQFEREAGADGSLYVGLARNGRPEDCGDGEDPRALALRHEVQQRRAAAREAARQHRALRHAGRAAGAGRIGERDGRWTRCLRVKPPVSSD